MITDIPKVIYKKDGTEMMVLKACRIYFKNYRKFGYVFHIENEEKMTTVSEFELIYKDEKYIVTRDVFVSRFEM